MKYLVYVINTLFMLLMFSVAGLFLVPLLPIEHNLELKIVESGSMEPAIMTGSLVAIWPAAHYDVGEVITFPSPGAEVPTTHRIANVYEDAGGTWFITKGDANEEADTQAVLANDVIGRVRIAIPYAGFILDFARQPLGFTFLILLPALMLIFGEVEKIWHEIKRRKKPQTDTKKNEVTTQPMSIETAQPQPVTGATKRPMMDIATPTRFYVLPTLDLRGVTPYPRYSTGVHARNVSRWPVIVFAGVLCATIIGSSFLGSTVSYFNDIEKTINNTLQAVALDFVVLPDGAQYAFENGQLVADDDGSLVTVVTPELDSVPLRHTVSVEITGGNISFCHAIIASSTLPVLYQGPLSTLIATDVLFDTPWSLALSLPDSTGLFNGESCALDIVFTAWHYDELTNQGYFDEERAPLTFELISSVIAPNQLIAQPVFSDTLLLSTATKVDTTSNTPSELSENTPTEVVEMSSEATFVEVPEGEDGKAVPDESSVDEQKFEIVEKTLPIKNLEVENQNSENLAEEVLVETE